MWFIGIVVILVLIHFLIIRPLTQRNRPHTYNRTRNFYESPREDDRPYYNGGGFGRVGTFAGGLAAGALLSYLFEQGRIGFDQYSAWQHLGDQEIMRELLDQNIIQEHEIDRLQEEIGYNNDVQNDRDFNHQDQVDFNDQDIGQDQSGFDDWNNGEDDNWV
jgi:hypothetical protein